MRKLHIFRHLIRFWIVILLLVWPRISVAQEIDIDSLVPKLETEINKMMLEGKVPSATVALVPSTVYLIGSTFKTMSMVALLQQLEQGKFKLDDRVNDFLTEFKIQGEDPAHPVTFRHLLSHTSGLPADFGPHPVWGDTVPLSLKDYLTKSLKLKQPTMTKTEYSNMAYTLVAYFIEKFSGTPYKKYIRDHIFKPLEMEDTDFFPRQDMEERLSIPYIVDRKTGHHKPGVRLKANVWPAGIVYT